MTEQLQQENNEIQNEMNIQTPEKIIKNISITPPPYDSANKNSDTNTQKFPRNTSVNNIHYNKLEYEIDANKRLKMLKTNSCGNIFARPLSTKRVSKNEEQKIISRMNNRFAQFQKNKNEKRERIKKQMEELRTKELKFKPNINRKSSVPSTHNKNENFLTRSTNFVQRNKNKNEQRRKDKEQNEKNTINPKLNKKGRLDDINKKLSSLFTWEESKKNRLENKKKVIREQEKLECTFKPAIDQKSKRLAVDNYYHKNIKEAFKNKSKSKIGIKKEDKGKKGSNNVEFVFEKAVDINLIVNNKDKEDNDKESKQQGNEDKKSDDVEGGVKEIQKESNVNEDVSGEKKEEVVEQEIKDNDDRDNDNDKEHKEEETTIKEEHKEEKEEVNVEQKQEEPVIEHKEENTKVEETKKEENVNETNIEKENKDN